MQEMQETWVQFLGRDDPLEKEMATHSGILSWETPWTEVDYSPWGFKELDTTERLSTHTHWNLTGIFALLLLLLLSRFSSVRLCVTP